MHETDDAQVLDHRLQRGVSRRLGVQADELHLRAVLAQLADHGDRFLVVVQLPGVDARPLAVLP